MRRYILFVMFLCLHWAAWGQGGYEYRYWFDTDDANPQTGTAAAGDRHIDADLSGMTCALHAIHLQVKDADGVWSAPVTRYFIKTPEDGSYTWHYWMDGDASGMVSGRYNGAPEMIDVSGLDDGFHVIYSQVSNNGSVSMPATGMFIKIPQTVDAGDMTCVCSIDGKPYKQERVPASGGTVSWQLDVAGLSHGLHRATVLVVTPSGAATNFMEQFFFRATTATELADMKLLYTVDGDDFRSEAGRFSNGLYHFDVDVAALDDGLHKISYMLTSETGTSTKVSTAFFFKTPVGGPGITSYRYWLNDNEGAARQTTLDKRQNPFSLITLLPVETCPIRSSCFRFEISEGSPVIYAMNDLHLQFFDVSGRMVEATRQFVDYKVSRAVDGIMPLAPNGSRTSAKPGENGINWYQLTAEAGDSLSFKTDKACTVQLFSPTGKEVYSASGDASVAYGGCHAYESGTYYLAVHDVKATYGSDITVDYQHIDKYAVLKYTPDSFGTPSSVNVEMFGNGFSDTVRVAIFNKDAEYWAKSVSSSDCSQLTATFDFPETITGTYSMKVLYTPEDSLCIENGINIAKADTVSAVSVSVEGNPFFLAGSSATYQIVIENHSNVPVYCFPYTVSIDCQDGDESTISSITIGDNIGEDMRKSFRDSLASYTDATRAYRLVNSLYDGKGKKFFMVYTDSATGHDVLVGDFVLPYINANSKVSIPLTIGKVTHNFRLRAAANKAWNMNCFIGKETENGIKSTCDIKSSVDELIKAVKTVPAFAGMLGSLSEEKVYKILQNSKSGIFSDIFCRGDKADFSELPKFSQPVLMDIVQSMIMAIVKEAKESGDNALLDKVVDEAQKDFSPTTGWRSSSNPHILWIVKVIKSGEGEETGDSTGEGTGEETGNGGGNGVLFDIDIVMINSWDPNDIYGYRSEAGSSYIKKNLDKVYYTIEFENDPVFATAAAHEVVVVDTLDFHHFNLSTFEPTSLKIGDRYVKLDGSKSFVTTVDMRPATYAIAQVELRYNEEKGIAKWLFSSLDPMTMEPTDDPMSGFLPVNSDGNGIGEVSFNIGLNGDYDDGVSVENRAAITFDTNEPIITPVWTNMTDTIAPESKISGCTVRNGNAFTLRFKGTDNSSGIWKYDLYVQSGTDAEWTKAAEGITESKYEFKGEKDRNYGFCVLATDSAGNVEQKALTREISKATYDAGDVNGDKTVNSLDVSLTVSKYLGNKVSLNAEAADINGDGIINSLDVTLIQQIYLASATDRSVLKQTRTRIRKK